MKTEEVLKKEGFIICRISGASMQPLLSPDANLVRIRAIREDSILKKYDIVLFKHGGKNVLHRIIDVHDDGTYDIRGDNTLRPEKNIRRDQIIGILEGIFQSGKYTDVNSSAMRVYGRRAVLLMPFRGASCWMRSIFTKLKRKLTK